VSSPTVATAPGDERVERLRALVRPEFVVDVYIAAADDSMLGLYGRKYKLGRAPNLMRLELQYALQCRRDARRGRWQASPVNSVARAVASCSDDDSFTTTAMPERIASRRALRRVWRYVTGLVRDVYDDPDDWRRDVWDLVKLGVGVKGRGQRFVDFQRLPQPWLRPVVKRCLRYQISRGLSASQLSIHYLALTGFAAWLAVHHSTIHAPHEVIGEVLEPYIVEVRARRHPVTARKRLLALRAFFEDADRFGWAAFGCRIFESDMPRDPKPEVRAIDEFVMAQLESPECLARIDKSDYRAVIELVMLNGMRISECLALPFKAVIYDSANAPQLTVPITKTGKEVNVIPVSQRTVDIVADQQHRVVAQFGRELNILFPRVFANPDGLLPVPYVSVSQALKRWLRTAEVHDRAGRPVRVTFHQFRHTLGTRMINQGVPTLVGMRLLGHKTIGMFQRYAVLNDRTLRQAWERFSTSRVDIRGELLQPACTDAEWTKERLGRALVATQNGYCGRPLQLECPHPNACLTCPDFLTDVSYLDAHRRQLAETERLMSVAQVASNTRMLEMNRQIAVNLTTIIASLEPFEQGADAS